MTRPAMQPRFAVGRPKGLRYVQSGKAKGLRYVRSLVAMSLLAIASPVLAQAPGAVAGVVDMAGQDAQPFVVPGVTLTLTCPAMPAGTTHPSVRVAVTDADGAYRIREVAPGSCSIVAELHRFQATRKTVTIQEDRTADVALRLALNVQVTRRLRIFGHNQTVGLKMFNITDHFNPRDYFSNVDGIRFGAFANGVGHTFRQMGCRFLDRGEAKASPRLHDRSQQAAFDAHRGAVGRC